MGFQGPAGSSGPVSGIPDPALKNNRDVLIWDGADWIASRVDWSELTGKPATFPPDVHGDAEHDATVASLSGGVVPDSELAAGAPAAGEFLAGSSRDWRAVAYAELASVPSDFPPEIHGDADHDATVASLTAGLVPDGELAGSGVPSATTFLRGDRTWATPAGGGGGGSPLLSIPFMYDGGWTNQPAALVNFLGSAGRPIVRIDLNWATEINLQMGLRAAGATGSALRVYYSSDDTTYATTGAEVSQTTAGFIESGWIALPAGALIVNCYLKLMGESGDAAADPQYSHITAFIR